MPVALPRLALGRPGTSYALRTAERLGLDESIVEDARKRIEPERLRIADLLAETEAAERTAANEREAARREQAEARRLAEAAGSREAGCFVEQPEVFGRYDGAAKW